ncbi:hypothetical protein VTO42DRAFT_2167 [Malbranchea cinnamomea]
MSVLRPEREEDPFKQENVQTGPGHTSSSEGIRLAGAWTMNELSPAMSYKLSGLRYIDSNSALRLHCPCVPREIAI